MSKDYLKQIADEMERYSKGHDRAGEMLSYCVGRLCLKSAKAGNSWRQELGSIDVPHIVDWLKAAIINDDAWLKNVDEQNRPKKLMKFGSFEDIQKEADKAMLRANQQNHDIKLIDSDEELYMQLEDGYHLVKLLTPAALDREGTQMQHCIGGGAYDENLNNNEHYFLSLRDGYGKPHATLEVYGDGVEQLQGKQNQAPNIKYTKTLIPFFVKSKLAIYIPIKNLGYVFSSEGNTYDIGDLPDSLEVNGSLNLSDTPIKSLPERLKVGGSLILERTSIKSLPEELEVGGNLILSDTSIETLPEGIKVGGDLDIRRSFIESLPEELEVGGDLSLWRTSIKSLPDGLEVNGNLNLYDTHITSLPEGLKVGGSLSLCKTPIKSLPEELEVGRDLDLWRSSIKSLPESFKISGHLNLSETPATSLPEGLKVGGSLSLAGLSIKSLPNSLEVNGDLNLSETPITSLPEGLKVGGDLYLKGSSIKSLPEGFKVGGRILGFTPELDQKNQTTSMQIVGL